MDRPACQHLWSIPNAKGVRECFWCGARCEASNPATEAGETLSVGATEPSVSRDSLERQALSTTTNAQADAHAEGIAPAGPHRAMPWVRGVVTPCQEPPIASQTASRSSAPAVVTLSTTAAPASDRRAGDRTDRGRAAASSTCASGAVVAPFLHPADIASRLIPLAGFFCALISFVSMPPIFARAIGNVRDQSFPEVPNV